MNSAGVLWIKGKPGSGKSTVARLISDRLAACSDSADVLTAESTTDRDKAVVVAGFFYSARLGLTAMGHHYMLRSVLYQLVTQNHLLYRHYQSTYRRLVQEQFGTLTWRFQNSKQDDRYHDALRGLEQDSRVRVSWFLEDLEAVFEKISTDESADRGKIFCILDGFDESVEGTVDVKWRDEYMSVRRRTLLWLTKLAVREDAQPWLKVMVLSRPTTDIRHALAGFHSITVEEFNQPAIEKIVDSGLTSISSSMRKWASLDSGRTFDMSSFSDWRQSPEPTLTTLRSIRERILKRANHTVLWVVLVLKELQAPLAKKGVYTLDTLDRALNDLPEGLEELYKELIHRLFIGRNEGAVIKARNMLVWACFAQRPLSLLEFRDAVAATGWRASSGLAFKEHLDRNRIQLFDADNLGPVERDVIDSCGCLLEVVYEVPTRGFVQVTHQTVRDFLVRQDRAAKPLDLSYDEADVHISGALHEYLVFCTETPISVPDFAEALEPPFFNSLITPLFQHCEHRPFLRYIMEYRSGLRSASSKQESESEYWHVDTILKKRSIFNELPAAHDDVTSFVSAMAKYFRDSHLNWCRFRGLPWFRNPEERFSGLVESAVKDVAPWATTGPFPQHASGMKQLNHAFAATKPFFPVEQANVQSNRFSEGRRGQSRSAEIQSTGGTRSTANSLLCPGCGMVGHVVAECLSAQDRVQLQGALSESLSQDLFDRAPPHPRPFADADYFLRRDSPSHRHTKVRCFRCNQRGHIKRDCPENPAKRGNPVPSNRLTPSPRPR